MEAHQGQATMPQSPVSTVVAPTTHIYHRVLDPDGQDSLAKLARQIAPGSRVLDLGAGPGVLGRYLREERGCTVDGVEYNPVAAAEAAPWYGQLECADLEGLALAEYFAEGQYDYIVCADILEHLRQPGEILAQLTRLLAPNGRVLVSVPNVAYAGLIAEMLAGEFRYRPEGLLDETHLRFFNRTSLIQLLEDHGLRVAVLDATFVELDESEFKEYYLDALPPAVVRALLGRPDALVYQFIITAQAAHEIQAAELPPLVGPQPELYFTCQLYWRAPQAEFQESESRVAWGRLGQTRQTVVLPIPQRPVPPEALRLDFADRPGLLRLYSLTLHDHIGQLLWAWDGRRDSLLGRPCQQVAFAESSLVAEEVTVLLAGDDPVLELPIPAETLVKLPNGGELRLELSWPVSLDYLALIQDCVPRQDLLTAQAATRAVQAAQAAQAVRIGELEQVRTVLTARIGEVEQDYAALNTCKEELETTLGALSAQLAEKEQHADVLQAQLTEQAAELAGLYGQRLVRWSCALRARLRPLRAWLQRHGGS